MTLLELRNKIWRLLPYSDIPTDYDLQAIMDLVAEYGEGRYQAGYDECYSDNGLDVGPGWRTP